MSEKLLREIAAISEFLRLLGALSMRPDDTMALKGDLVKRIYFALSDACDDIITHETLKKDTKPSFIKQIGAMNINDLLDIVDWGKLADVVADITKKH